MIILEKENKKTYKGGKMMYKFLYSPKEAIKSVEKSKLGMTFLYLLISVVLWFFAVKIQGSTWLASFYILLGALLLVLVGSLVLNLAVAVFKKADYLKSLLTLVVPWFILSVLALVSSLLALIPAVGAYLVALLMVFVLPYTMLIEIKMFMDLFKLDIVTTIVILFVLGAATAAGFTVLLGSFATQLAGKIGFGLLPSLL